MSIYKTGRSRTISFTASLSGLFAEQFSWGVLEDSPPPHAAAGSVILTSPWGARVIVQIATRDDTAGVPHPVGYADFDAGALLSVSTGISGGTASGYCWNEDNHRVLSGEYWNWSWNWSGSAVMSLEVEECIELSAPDSVDSQGFVTHGGSAVDDMPKGLKVRLFERAKTNGLATTTVWIDSCSQSVSSTVTPGSEFEISGYELGHYLHYVSVINNNATMTAAGRFNGVDLTATYYKSLSGSFAQTTSGASIGCNSTSNIPKNALLEASIAPSKAYDLSGVIRRWDEAYPGSVVLQIDRKSGASAQDLTASGGSFSDTVSQDRYSCDSVLNSVDQDSASIDEWLDLRLWIKGTALSGLGEDSRDWRVFLHGRAYDAIELSEPGTAVIDTCDSLSITSGMTGTWESVSDTTVSAVGGKIEAQVTGASGSFRRSFDPPGLLRDYRFMKIEGEVSAGTGAFVVQIGQKSWDKDYLGNTLSFTTAAGSVYLDLCAPSNASLSVDSYDTRWPIPTAVDTINSNGALFGVHNATAIVFSGLASGLTYRIDKLALVRALNPPFATAGWSLATFLPAFDDWTLQTEPVVVGDTTTYTYVRRFLLGDTDGKQSLEEIDAIKTVVVSSAGTSITYTTRSIENLVDDINLSNHPAENYAIRNFGWGASLKTAINFADGADYSALGTGYLNKNRPAFWLHGAGALYEPSGWSYGLDIDCSTVQTIKAQLLFDQINWYPEIGDPFLYGGTPGAYGGALIIRASKILRAQGHGLCFENDMRHAAITVSAVDAGDSSDAGSATSEPFGRYLSGSPYGRGNRTITVSAGALNYSRLWKGRRRSRVSFRELVGGVDWISCDVSIAGRFVRAYNENGTVVFGAAQDVLGISWHDSFTNLSGSTPCVRYDRWSRGQPLFLQICQADTINLYKTLDEGILWSFMQTIGQGAYNTFFVNEDGRQFHYYLRSGTIYGVVLDAVGGTIVPEFVAISGADTGAIAAHRVYVGQGGFRVKLLYTQSGMIVSATSQDGENFS